MEEGEQQQKYNVDQGEVHKIPPRMGVLGMRVELHPDQTGVDDGTTSNETRLGAVKDIFFAI